MTNSTTATSDTARNIELLRSLRESDPAIADAIGQEIKRQNSGLELIASENFVSNAVLEAMGSPLTNKYAEGYPGRRYYGGCEFVDISESLAIERAKKIFGAEHANVQPHSGAKANKAAYFSLLKPGDTVLGMDLAHGGHLTHGHPLNFSGQLYKIVPYGVRQDDERIDYENIERLAREHQPQLIMVGASAYPRVIDFSKIAEPNNPSTEEGRLYLKQLDANNNALAIKLQKAGNMVEVELTSPGCVCECGSTDGAKDPIYNFAEGIMIVELYCGHSYSMDIPNLRRIQ